MIKWETLDFLSQEQFHSHMLFIVPTKQQTIWKKSYMMKQLDRDDLFVSCVTF